MKPKDKRKIIDRYLERVEKFGHGSTVLGETKGRQALYFDAVSGARGFAPGDAVLDVGCGYGDLRSYLRSTGWNGRYTGIDINPTLVDEGKRRTPGIDLRVVDLQESHLEAGGFDWCVSFHVLTSDTEEVSFIAHLEQMLGAMWALCHKGIVFNQLSPLVDYVNPVHARIPIGQVVDVVTKLTRRFTVKHDYMPFEYAIYAYKDDSIDRELLIFGDERARLAAANERWDQYRDSTTASDDEQ